MSTGWATLIVTLSIVVGLLTAGFVTLARRVTVTLARVDAWLAKPDLRPPGLQPGSHVQPFAAVRQDGRLFSDLDLIGRRSMVLFMKSECVACRGLARQISRRVLNDLGIGDTTYVVLRDEHERDLLALDPDLEIAFQADGVVAWAFRSSATPHGFVIDESGVVAASGFPSSPEQVGALFGRLDQEQVWA